MEPWCTCGHWQSTHQQLYPFACIHVRCECKKFTIPTNVKAA